MLFIMRGTSCSGKDSFIDNNFKNNNHVLSSDNFREMLIGDITSQNQNKYIFNKLKEVLESRFINKVNWTVINSTNLRIRDCSSYIELCKKYRVPYTFISIIPPSLDELVYRNNIRNLFSPMNIHIDVLERHHNRYEASKQPFLDETYNSNLCTWIEIDQEWEVNEYIK